MFFVSSHPKTTLVLESLFYEKLAEGIGSAPRGNTFPANSGDATMASDASTLGHNVFFFAAFPKVAPKQIRHSPQLRRMWMQKVTKPKASSLPLNRKLSEEWRHERVSLLECRTERSIDCKI